MSILVYPLELTTGSSLDILRTSFDKLVEIGAEVVPFAPPGFEFVYKGDESTGGRRMKEAVVVLQYPDPRLGRTVAIAATKHPKVLQTFKKVVLDEAERKMSECDDEVLYVQERAELERLGILLGMLIP